LALVGRREEVVAAIEHASRKTVGVMVTLDLPGTGIESAQFFAWPVPPLKPDRVIIDLVAQDGERLPIPMTWEMKLEPHEREQLTVPEVPAPPATKEVVWAREQRWERVAPGTEYREWRSRTKIHHAVANDATYTASCPTCGHIVVVRQFPDRVRECFSCRRFAGWRRERLRLFRNYISRPSGTSAHRAARIRELKATGRYTQSDIAKLVGVTPQYVSKICKGLVSSSSTPDPTAPRAPDTRHNASDSTG
jgi:DNA-binding XRE family transcriptional regulator